MAYRIIHITPDAGTVKTNRFRNVPIHPHLIEMGFLDYVSTRSGPLFYYGEFPADVMAHEMELFPRYAIRPTAHEAVAA